MASTHPPARPVYVSMAVIVGCLITLQLYAGMISERVMASYSTGAGGILLDQGLAVGSYESLRSENREQPPLQGGSEAASSEGGKDSGAQMTDDETDNAESRCLSQPWISRHVELQEAMLSGARPARYLVLQPECGYCGMCNRLNSILGSYLLAVLLGRAFVIDWKWAGRGVMPDTKYLQPNLVNWEASAATGGKESFEWDDSKRKVFKGWGDFDEMRDVLDKTDFSEFEPWEAVVFHWIGESPQLALRKNPIAKKLAVEAGVMSEETVWDEAWDEEFKKCAVRALFKPTRRLRDAYCQVLRHGGAAGKQEPDGPVRGRGVGIHVRTGDDRTWNQEHADPKDEHFRFARCADGIREAFLANASRLLPSTPARPVDMDTWHLASDYQKVVDDVEERYPDRIASLDDLSALQDNSSPVRQHSAGTPHEQFTLGPLLDLLLISSGIAVVGTCRSTFSASAAYFGMLPPELTILKRTNFEMRYFHSNACPEMPEQAQDMCRDVIAQHPRLVRDVLRTPPFITCEDDGREAAAVA